MVTEDARSLRLLRDRDAAKRTVQLWLALTAVWAIVVGWVAWGLINAVTDDAIALAWLVYVLPLIVLAVITTVSYARLRRINEALLSAAEHPEHRHSSTPHPEEKS